MSGQPGDGDQVPPSGEPCDPSVPAPGGAHQADAVPDDRALTVDEVLARHAFTPSTDRVAAPGHSTGGAVVTAPQHRHPFFNYIWHTAVAVVSVFVLAVTGIYWNIVAEGSDNIAKASVNAGIGGPGPEALFSDSETAAPTDSAAPTTSTTPTAYSPENFLLVGSDTRAGANDIDNSESKLEGVANTDSVMVLHISGDRQHIYAMSLPRDMWLPNVKCERYDQSTNTYGGTAAGANLTKQHTNAFYGVGGPKCLVDAVENATQLTITRYIQIDFSGFKAMVDALGGVTINACGPIVDETLSTVLASGGEQVINGGTALSLARARKVIGDPSSDLSRIHRQQLILSAILREVKSAGTLLDPVKLGKFVKAFTDNTTTGNVGFDDLMNLAVSIGDLDPAKVNFYTIPTVADPNDVERGSMFIDKDKSAPLLDALRNDTVVPGSEPTPEATTAPTTAAPVSTLTVAPGAVDLRISNASGRSGVAGSASKALNAVGFATSSGDLSSADSTQTGITVQYSAGNEAAALTVASALPGSTLAVVDGQGSVVTVLLGSDYDEKVVQVAVGDPIAAALLAAVPAGSAGNVAVPTSDSTATTTTPAVNAADATCL